PEAWDHPQEVDRRSPSMPAYHSDRPPVAPDCASHLTQRTAHELQIYTLDPDTAPALPAFAELLYASDSCTASTPSLRSHRRSDDYHPRPGPAPPPPATPPVARPPTASSSASPHPAPGTACPCQPQQLRSRPQPWRRWQTRPLAPWPPNHPSGHA